MPLRSPTVRHALTMIELLVVVAVMALLASLLLPAARSIRESAQIVGCGGNQRQMAQANLVYAAEHDGLVVPPRMIDGSNQDETQWDIQLMKVLEDRGKVIRCPADRLPLQTTWVGGLKYEGRRSFSYVCWYDDAWTPEMKRQALAWEPKALTNRPAGSRRLAQVDAAGTALLCECPGTAQGIGVVWASTRRRVGEVGTPHRARSNFAFVDGHVGLHAPRESAGSTAQTVSIFNQDRGVEHAKGFWTVTAGD